MTQTDPLATSRLILSRSSTAELSSLIAGPSEYQRAFVHRVEEGFIDFPGALEFSLQQAQSGSEAAAWWLPYLIVHRSDDAVIGVCGSKGPPDDDGVIEIGYCIAPAYRGQGLGGEAAAALVRYSLALPGITGVLAHTLPEINASTRILSRCGFTRIEEIIDPDDGTVWRWQMPSTDGK